jgi:hypothetical protein
MVQLIDKPISVPISIVGAVITLVLNFYWYQVWVITAQQLRHLQLWKYDVYIPLSEINTIPFLMIWKIGYLPLSIIFSAVSFMDSEKIIL